MELFSAPGGRRRCAGTTPDVPACRSRR